MKRDSRRGSIKWSCQHLILVILAHGPFCTLDPQLGYLAAAGVQFGGHFYLSFPFFNTVDCKPSFSIMLHTH